MTLKNYPETIRLSNGEIVENLKIKQYLESNNTSEIVEFYEIKL